MVVTLFGITLSFPQKSEFNVGLLADLHLILDYNPYSSAHHCRVKKISKHSDHSVPQSLKNGNDIQKAADLAAPLGRLGCDSN